MPGPESLVTEAPDEGQVRPELLQLLQAQAADTQRTCRNATVIKAAICTAVRIANAGRRWLTFGLPNSDKF